MKLYCEIKKWQETCSNIKCELLDLRGLGIKCKLLDLRSLGIKCKLLDLKSLGIKYNLLDLRSYGKNLSGFNRTFRRRALVQG